MLQVAAGEKVNKLISLSPRDETDTTADAEVQDPRQIHN